jgi:hypothetical protein
MTKKILLIVVIASVVWFIASVTPPLFWTIFLAVFFALVLFYWFVKKNKLD